MFAAGQSRGRKKTGAGAGPRQDRGKRKVCRLTEEERLALKRNVHSLNGNPDSLESFFQGFRRKFPYTDINDLIVLEQVLMCIRGEPGQVALEYQEPLLAAKKWG